jgi:hypothetical protein
MYLHALIHYSFNDYFRSQPEEIRPGAAPVTNRAKLILANFSAKISKIYHLLTKLALIKEKRREQQHVVNYQFMAGGGFGAASTVGALYHRRTPRAAFIQYSCVPPENISKHSKVESKYACSVQM